MKRNEKILAAALVCIVVGYFGWGTIDAIFIAPTRDARDELARTEQQVRDKDYELTDLKTAEVQIAEWAGEGLPSDPTTGQRLYMLWLRDVAALSGLEATVEKGTRTNSGGAYVAVQANLKGDGTFAELKNFLEIVRRVNLMHRIVRLDVGPVGSAEGNPRLPIEIMVEGLSIRRDETTGTTEESEEENEKRIALFPRAELPKELGAEATTLAAFGEALRVRAGDRLRVGEELVTVVDAGEETLTVERGVNGTSASAHEAGTEVEVYPSRPDAEGLEQFAAIDSFFVKPSAPSESNTPPRLAELESRTVFHGDTIEWELDGSDEETPEELTYEVKDAPDGISIDDEVGTLTWKVPESVKPGETVLVVTVSDAGEPSMSEATSLTVTVKENLKPYVYLVGTTSRGEAWDAWLWDRSEGKRISLHEGRPFEAVGISGTVEEISADGVILDWDGKLWELGLGENLGEMAEVEREPVAAFQPPVEAPQPAVRVVADAGTLRGGDRERGGREERRNGGQ